MENEASTKKLIENVKIIRVIGRDAIPVEDQSFVLSVIENLSNQCYTHKIVPSVVLCDEEQVSNVVERTLAEHFDAMIVLAYDMTQAGAQKLIKYQKPGFPLIVLGTSMQDSPISTVNLSNAELGYMAVRYLYECGYRSIGYLRSKYDYWCFTDRAEGFYQAIDEFKMECALELRAESTVSGAYRDTKEWLKKRQKLPRAFFADNDNTAIGSMNALVEAGYRIPEDISIIAMDDIVFSAFSSTPLTTIHVSRKQIARETINLLLEGAGEDPVRVSCLGKLVVRKSTRRFDADTEEKMILKV